MQKSTHPSLAKPLLLCLLLCLLLLPGGALAATHTVGSIAEATAAIAAAANGDTIAFNQSKSYPWQGLHLAK